MASGITLWGRAGEPDTADALQFLKRHGYAADAVRDLAKSPPSPTELAALGKGFGGSLLPLVAPGAAPPAGDDVAAWLAADWSRARSPVLLTPKGAVAGFRERRWSEFLGITGRQRG
ncbi:MAG: hypothetical protein QOD77_854 [Thermoplasmata archaeon]|jgi:arsenate reductase-like glutaredoxin family protein|nr:hypothetical protein [Thermoplasmata archaeon]